MRTTMIVTAAVLASAGTLGAQAPDAAALAERVQTLVIEGSIRGDDAAIREATALAERGLAAHPGDAWLLHYQGFALYRQAARHACDEAAEPRCVWRLLERAEASLEASLEAREIPESHALLASVYGLMIAENGALGASLGSRADEARRAAFALDPDNPRAWLLKGIGEIYTPPAYGGGAVVALRSLEEAARAFEADAPEPPAPRWGEADVHVWLGQVHRALGDVDAARAAYERALEIAPDHAWVREDLLPALDRAGG